MKFSDYPLVSEIKEQLAKMGFKKPTDIQFKAIKPILDGEDVFAIAQTGTGKTGAFVIPTLHRLQSRATKHKKIRCLVMVPTRELAKQIAEVFVEVGKKTKIKTLGLYGGVEQDSQINALVKGVDVLVATPGRMFDLISQGYLDVSALEFLILDEADLMLNYGFLKDVKAISQKIPKKRQTLFFSATIDKKIKSLAYDLVKDAIRIQISPKNPVSKNVIHAVAFVEMDDKRFFLENTLAEFTEAKFVVFVRTKVRVERVVKAMERVGIATVAFHGGIDQKERFGILDEFRSGKTRVLVTTDAAARGIDIPSVEYVINYDLPDNAENYVHRCGRCGRGNNTGQALSFCSESEKLLLEQIEEYTGEEIERYEIHPEDYKSIMIDTEDLEYNWKRLIDQANKESGTEDEWE